MKNKNIKYVSGLSLNDMFFIYNKAIEKLNYDMEQLEYVISDVKDPYVSRGENIEFFKNNNELGFSIDVSNYNSDINKIIFDESFKANKYRKTFKGKVLYKNGISDITTFKFEDLYYYSSVTLIDEILRIINTFNYIILYDETQTPAFSFTLTKTNNKDKNEFTINDIQNSMIVLKVENNKTLDDYRPLYNTKNEIYFSVNYENFKKIESCLEDVFENNNLEFIYKDNSIENKIPISNSQFFDEK